LNRVRTGPAVKQQFEQGGSLLQLNMAANPMSFNRLIAALRRPVNGLFSLTVIFINVLIPDKPLKVTGVLRALYFESWFVSSVNTGR
jgi:hypothetical protein